MCREHEQYYLNQEKNEEQRRTVVSRALKAVEDDPQNVSKLYELASAFGQNKLFSEQLEIYRTIQKIDPLSPADPRAIKIVNGMPLERNAQLYIAGMLQRMARDEGPSLDFTNLRLRMPEIEREFFKAIEIQPDCAQLVYGQLASSFKICGLWAQAVTYYRKLLSAKQNDSTYIEYLGVCLVELATEQAASKSSPYYKLSSVYNEALPLLRRALVNDMDRDDNPELKEYLARALDGINEHEEATAIRNKIQRARQRKEEDRRQQEQRKRPPPLPLEFQTKFDKLYYEEQKILNSRYGLPGLPLISVETTAEKCNMTQDFVRHVEEIALQKLGVDADYMKALRAEYRKECYEAEKARRPKGMVIPGPDEERTTKFPPRSHH